MGTLDRITIAWRLFRLYRRGGMSLGYSIRRAWEVAA